VHVYVLFIEDIATMMKIEKRKDLAIACVSIVVMVMLMALFWNNNLLLTIIATIYATFLLLIWHEAEDLMCFFFVLVIGTASEIIAVNFNVYTYNNPTFLGIPIWLPLAWGTAALCLRRIIISLKSVENRK
jgi:hypothetical protein